MAQKKPHLVYSKAPEGTAKFHYSFRGGPEKDEVIPNYFPKKEDFKKSLAQFTTERDRRLSERNPSIQVNEIACIEFLFHSYFDSASFEIKYRADFGLTPIKYFDLNKRILFAIKDEQLFLNLIKNLQIFIGTDNHVIPSYNANIKFIKEFNFHTTENILSGYDPKGESIHLQIIDNIELFDETNLATNVLTNYLASANINFVKNAESNEIELIQAAPEIIEEVARNFDIVHSINSNQYRVTRPTRYGTNIKEYPFQIQTPSEDLPIFGIIDTGISNETPLSSVLLNKNNDFGLNGMNPRVDETHNGDGHGTGVAGFVVLGNQLSGSINKVLLPDAKILSIKVLADGTGKLTNKDIADLILKAHGELNIKYYTLTICYDKPLKKGEMPSDYAFLLDKIAYQHDLLIFICTANYTNWNENEIESDYPNHFRNDELNFCTPADSFNNLIVGAIGDNLEPELPILLDKYPLSSSLHPAFYTRKFHLDYENLKLKNGNLIKPDVVFSGGNLTIINHKILGKIIEDKGESAIQYLSANPGEPILRGIGTSFSTPLVANIAAKILRRFPEFKPQTVKAIILNSCKGVNLGNQFKDLSNFQKKYIVGHGRPRLEKCLYSTDNEVTIIIEEKIDVDTVMSMPIIIPDYLNEVSQNKTLLGVEATLCYRFMPLQNNQLAYCPVNIAFGIFKNVALENNGTKTTESGKQRLKRSGISGGSKEDISLVQGWSQDAYNKGKMLSNTQKVSYYIKKEQIINESNQFKIAVNCHFHKILPEYVTSSLPKEYEFSLVIRIWDNQNSEKLQDRLYSDLQILNELEILPDITIEGEAEAEADEIL